MTAPTGPRNFDWAQLAQDCRAFIEAYADTVDPASDTILGSFLGRILRTAGASIPAVPDPGQAREQILQRDITFGEYIIAVCDAIGLPHDSPRAVVVEAIRAAVAAAQAPESPTDSTPKAGRWGSGEAETTTGGGQAPDVAGPLVAVRVGPPGSGYLVGPFTPAEAVAWRKANVTVPGMQWAIVPLLPDAARPTAEALLGTDTTPDRLAWISEAGETAAAERHARYQETACARRPAEEHPDA